ncbi:MAG: pyruvate formate lyase family protein, partial [Bacillota bacterium]|nr:pyruvate formate lyase family protein [Bacillota bacterium]
MRERYRNTQPEICTSRYRLITEFYMEHPELTGILKRALNFKHICENIAIRIDEGEVIVGAQSSKYRACALYPENSIDWLLEELESGFISTRDIDPYIVSEEDREYILQTGDFWRKECMSAKMNPYIPPGYFKHMYNGVIMLGPDGWAQAPVGHFCADYNTAIRRGFGAIKAEADAKVAEIEEKGIFGDSIDKYNFYRAVSIVCEAMITYTKRYARL